MFKDFFAPFEVMFYITNFDQIFETYSPKTQRKVL